MPGLPVHHHLPELTQTHVHQDSDAIQPSHPLSSLLLLPPIPPSIRVFSSESALRIRWPMYWSFSLNISPSSEHPGLISLRMDWLDLLAVQGTLRSLLQHHSSEASVLRLQSAPMGTGNSRLRHQVALTPSSSPDRLHLVSVVRMSELSGLCCVPLRKSPRTLSVGDLPASLC